MATDDEMARLVEILEGLVQDRRQLFSVPEELRQRLLTACGRLAHPGRSVRRRMTRANRQKRRAELDRSRQRDEKILQSTGIRARRGAFVQTSAPPHPFGQMLPPGCELPDQHFGERLESPRNCYICKKDFDQVHFFYDSLCPDCSEFNWQKRNETADLSGRTALVTGGRVKIGFAAALKLLRAGALVAVTSRFPLDAVRRFLEQEDSHLWEQRLQVFGLDLRDLSAVESFADHLGDTLTRLDFVLNNACQTVRRPPAFYAHLMEGERQLAMSFSTRTRQRLDSVWEETQSERSDLAAASGLSLTSPDNNSTVASSHAACRSSAELSQTPLLPEDFLTDDQLFPRAQFDDDGQQVDLRSLNSWRLKLAQVSTVELLEVHLVNAMAPFILNARLKPLMKQVPTQDKHIVNVSAMEGVFYRAFKRDAHPHTNMAKSALNMMTRTSAADYVKDGIHMNSVDTGWITDEDPIDIALRKREERRFHTPLDEIDAAARVCNPIFSGLNSGKHEWGKFLKDYQVSNW